MRGTTEVVVSFNVYADFCVIVVGYEFGLIGCQFADSETFSWHLSSW